MKYYAKCLTLILLIGLSLLISECIQGDIAVKSDLSSNEEEGEISLVNVQNVAERPLRVGEKLTYKVKVRGISAGKRVDYIQKTMVWNGQRVYHISSDAKTGAWARWYHFRSHQSTFLKVVGFHPLRFRNQVQDKKYRAFVEINFREGLADYQKRSQSDPKSPEKRDKKEIEIPIGTQDELSMVYFLRTKQIAAGNTYIFPLIIRGELRKMELKVERGEVLSTKALGKNKVKVKTLLVRTSDGGKLWLTDDALHLPIKIEANTKIGKTTATLEKIEIVK